MMKIISKTRNIFSAVKPLYILSKVFGIAHLRFKSSVVAPDNFKGSVGLKGSTFGSCLYSLTILIILIIFHCVSLHLKIRNIYKRLKYTFILTDSFNSVLTFATVFISIFQVITFNRNKLVVIFSKLNKSDKFTLRYSESDVRYRKTYILFLLNIIFTALIFGFLCTYDVFSNFKENIIISMTRYTSHVIRILMNMQFVSFNLLIKHRFDLLNKQLLSVFGVRSERELENGILDDISMACTRKYKNPPDYRNARFQKKNYTNWDEYYDFDKKLFCKESLMTDREYSLNASSESQYMLIQLRINHNEICNISRLVFSTYGVFTIFELLNIIADIITVLYFSLDFVISESYISLEKICWCSSWLLLHAAKLIGITRSCQLLTTCGNHTSVLVGKLMLFSRPKSRNTMIQLQKFSHQLLHTNINASACDFLDLNNTLLGSVAKVAITYVIVLLLNQKI